MATQTGTVRRGLPRWPGGEPWPPAGDVAVEVAVPPTADAVASGQPRVMADAAVTASARAPETVSGSDELGSVVLAPMVAAPVVTAASAGGMLPTRRGLRRVAGGEPWPAAGEVIVPASVAAAAPGGSIVSTPETRPDTAGAASATATTPVVSAGPATAIPAGAASEPPLRRGLPRVKGSDALPVARTAPASMVTGSGGTAQEAKDEVAPAAAAPVPTPIDAAAQPLRTRPARPGMSARPTAQATLPAPARSAPTPVPARESGRFGAYTRRQLLGFAVVGGFAVLGAATVVVVAAVWFRNLPFMQDFLTTYPGEYHLPEGTAAGFPAWVQWQHFFNVFLLVLIIRSGLQVRTEKRPGAFWTPKWSKDGKGKISLALWFHQSLDVLWLVNGVIFVVLLFVTGHWMRIVPTSWEVFPNALSAMLQYVSLDWPTENGWVNYNSLQQLMYFLTVFVAAPLAAITGVRMSGMWPKNAKTLNRVYPVEWARAVHFPVMLYFVAFIIVHVALVFATGALRNLNHMYGGTDVVNWAGFWIFFASLLIIVGGWIAARPLVLAPIAKVIGKVSAR